MDNEAQFSLIFFGVIAAGVIAFHLLLAIKSKPGTTYVQRLIFESSILLEALWGLLKFVFVVSFIGFSVWLGLWSLSNLDSPYNFLVIIGEVIWVYIAYICFKAMKSRPDTTYLQRFRSEAKFDIKATAKILKDSLIAVSKFTITLAVLGGLIWFAIWAWSALDEEWVCYTKDGGIIYTESKPKGDWVESESGTRYPQEVIASCHEREKD